MMADMLQRAIGRFVSYESVGNDPIRAVQFCDIGIAGCALLIPSPVN
jgi:hypothetical protein